MLVSLDPVSAAIVDLIRSNGYDVAFSQTQDGLTHYATARHPNGEQHKASGEDLYVAICELAELCGIELEDG